MKIRPTILYSLIAFVLLVGVAVVSYQLGSRHSRKEMAAMQEEMDRLREAEKDAAIVKRVSQQMEDIAYQQKFISDQQRDRAKSSPSWPPAMQKGPRWKAAPPMRRSRRPMLQPT